MSEQGTARLTAVRQFSSQVYSLWLAYWFHVNNGFLEMQNRGFRWALEQWGSATTGAISSMGDYSRMSCRLGIVSRVIRN